MKSSMDDGPSAKRRKIDSDTETIDGHSLEQSSTSSVEDSHENLPRSSLLNVPISPPRAAKAKEAICIEEVTDPDASKDADVNDVEVSGPNRVSNSKDSMITSISASVSSPIQLSYVEGLPASANVDTVRLRDILGHPLISECWAFNYLFDVDFLLCEFLFSIGLRLTSLVITLMKTSETPLI